MAQQDYQNPDDPFALNPRGQDGFDPIYLGARTSPDTSQLPGKQVNTMMGFDTPTDTTGSPDPSQPPADTTQTPDTTTPREAHHGGPATGQQTGGQPTGPAPSKDAPAQQTTTQTGPDYSVLQGLLERMIAGQSADREAVAAQRAALQGTLDRVIKSAERPVSATDAGIAGPTTAFNAQGQRARRMMQEQLAQEAAATGKTTGSVDADVQRSFEDLGNATGSYEGGLMVNELKSRRDQLQAALMTGAGMLNAQDQARLQEELSTINGQIAMQDSKKQNQQFYDRLGFDMGSQSNTLDEILSQMFSSGSGSLAA